MAAYKDKMRNTWFCQFYYTDWQGNRKQKKKRGFRTKREALEWESQYKQSISSDMEMTVADFVETYFRDKDGELKGRSKKNKRSIIDNHIIPYFGKRRMNELLPADIIAWQNEMRGKGFSQTYLRVIQNQLTALYSHAYKIYDLGSNPCKKVKKMGQAEAGKLDFWTKEEYDKFIDTFEEDDRNRLIYEILFWTGCREGELLALTKNDVDLENRILHINKTYYRLNGKKVISTPKTEQSVRDIDISEFLKREIADYFKQLGDYPSDKRIFDISAEAVQHTMKRHILKAGVKKIRVHDLRHSHVAFLIYHGIEPLIIKERLGHKDIRMTLNTYGHLYPSQQKKLAEMLDLVR